MFRHGREHEYHPSSTFGNGSSTAAAAAPTAQVLQLVKCASRFLFCAATSLVTNSAKFVVAALVCVVRGGKGLEPAEVNALSRSVAAAMTQPVHETFKQCFQVSLRSMFQCGPLLFCVFVVDLLNTCVKAFSIWYTGPAATRIRKLDQIDVFSDPLHFSTR